MNISLPNGLVAIIDDADAKLVEGIKWRAVKKPPAKTWYVVADIGGKRWTLHRWLLKPKSKQKLDHRDGDGLNNRRENIRPCTQSQNMANVGRTAANKSGFKGVHRHNKSNRWRVQISVNNKILDVGYFADKTEAAKAYDAAAIKHFGQFAKTNFPSEAGVPQ